MSLGSSGKPGGLEIKWYIPASSLCWWSYTGRSVNSVHRNTECFSCC